MKTYKPISSISYMEPHYLLSNLRWMKTAEIIEQYCFTVHKPDGTSGDEYKEHCHIYIVPAKTIDTESYDFKQWFIQPVSNQRDLGTMPFRKSKFDDWYLYCSHDIDYCQSKGLKKSQYNIGNDYYPDRWNFSDKEYFKSLIEAIDTFKLLSPVDRMIYCYNNGMTKLQAMSYLRIPYASFYSFSRMWDCMCSDYDNSNNIE